MRLKKWLDASLVFEQAVKSYEDCRDYLMQAESLRLCGWCLEKRGENKQATQCYIQGFRLVDKIAAEHIRNSAFPLLLLKLINNKDRMEEISDEDMDRVLTPILGQDWLDYLYSYKKNLGKFYGDNQQDN